MNINWNIHGFPEDEQKEIVKNAMYNYCYEVCNMKIDNIFIDNCVQKSYNTYRIMIRLLIMKHFLNLKFRNVKSFLHLI